MARQTDAVKITTFKVWRKLLPILYVFVLVHFLKDVTQDILKISTPLDFLGDIKEDLSSFPVFVQSLLLLLGIGSFVAEVFLLVSIPFVMKKKIITSLEKIIWTVSVALLFYFLMVIFLDPRLRLV